MRNDFPLQFRVHLSHGSRCALRFEFTEVFRPKEELPVEIALLYSIEIGHVDDTLRTRPETHHAPGLQHLAADRAGPYKELPGGSDLRLERFAKNGNLAVVPRTLRLAIGFTGDLFWH